MLFNRHGGNISTYGIICEKLVARSHEFNFRQPSILQLRNEMKIFVERLSAKYLSYKSTVLASDDDSDDSEFLVLSEGSDGRDGQEHAFTSGSH